MKNYTFKIFALLFMFGVLITSCDVDLSNPEVDSETTEDNALGERAVGDVFGMVNTGTGGGKAAGCGDFAWDANNNILAITFDGTCESPDGVIRNGIIHAQFTGVWKTVGSTVKITFINYKRGDKMLSGTIDVEYLTIGETPTFTVTASNMKLIFTDGRETTWDSSNSYIWVAGATTPLDKNDDSYSVTGTTSGFARNGNEFSRVATRLVTTPDCKWFTSGNLILTITNGDESDIYNMTFTEPCGTVTIVYKGISVTRTLD